MIIKTREKILKERKDYYSNTFVRLEMVKCLSHRELAFLSLKTEEKKKALRYMVGSSLEYFDKHMKFFYVDESLINLYMSIAKFGKDIPIFSYNLEKRKKEEKYIEFNDNFKDYVGSVNFFFDIDGKEVSFEKLHDEAKILKKIFDDLEVPYYVMPSSFKGFHFHIPCEYMPEMDIMELLVIINNILYNLKGIYELECLDNSVADLKRLAKVPFSFSCDGSICLPLDDIMFREFKPYMIEYENVMRFQRIMKRGLKVRTFNRNEDILKRNVLNFIDEYK